MIVVIIIYGGVNMKSNKSKTEYIRNRRVLFKRIDRLSKKYNSINPSFYGYYYPPASTLSSREISSLNKELRKDLSNPELKLSTRNRINKKLGDTLRSHGYNISDNNIESFKMFMEYAREITEGMFFDSEEAAELFESSQNIDVSTIMNMYSEWSMGNDIKG